MVRTCFLSSVILLGFILPGCAPSISPLFRDYQVPESLHDNFSEDDVYERIRMALAEAGWTEVESDVPDIITTAPRWSSSWGIYRTEVTLDIIPIRQRHVRILFHPIRHSLLGGRTKLPYLDSGLRSRYLRDLNNAFSAQGFEVLGTPRERDRENDAE